MAIRESEWVRKLKHGGAVPMLQVEDCFNGGWASPPGNFFHVRGRHYLTNKAKIRGGEWSLMPLAFDWLKSSTKIFDVMRHPHGRVGLALHEARKSPNNGLRPFVWSFNLQVPSKDNHSLVFYFLSYTTPPDGSLMSQFLNGDADFRNSRLKLIANIAKGPWIVKKTVGEQAICIPGKALCCEYFQREDFIEVDVDIGASVIANAVVHLAFGYVTSLTVDIAFVIEGQTESELPEKILGAIRFSNLDPAEAASLEWPRAADDGKIDAERAGSFTSRLWRSVSSLLHVGHGELVDQEYERRKSRMASAINPEETEEDVTASNK